MLSREDVLRIATLARIDLSEAEIEHFRTKLGNVLEHIRDLNSLDTGSEGFVRHIPRDAVAFRADKPLVFGAREAILQNAPAIEDGGFLIPTVVEHS